MAHRVKRDINRPLRVTPENLRLLLRALPHHDKGCSLSVDCRHGFSYSFKSLDELLELPNSKSTAIERIRISSPWDHFPQIQITLSNSDFDPITYEIVGDIPEIQAVESQIKEKLEPIYEHYLLPRVGSNTYSARFGAFLGGFICLVPFCIFLLNRNIRIHHPYTIALVGTLVFAAIFWGTPNGPFAWLCPPISFCIGNGVDRHKAKLQTRQYIFWTVVIGTLLELAREIVSRHFLG